MASWIFSLSFSFCFAGAPGMSVLARKLKIYQNVHLTLSFLKCGIILVCLCSFVLGVSRQLCLDLILSLCHFQAVEFLINQIISQLCENKLFCFDYFLEHNVSAHFRKRAAA
jgi:hypothetical protein